MSWLFELSNISGPETQLKQHQQSLTWLVSTSSRCNQGPSVYVQVLNGFTHMTWVSSCGTPLGGRSAASPLLAAFPTADSMTALDSTLRPSSEWRPSPKLFTLQCSNEIAHLLFRRYFRWILSNANTIGEFIGSGYSLTLSALFYELYCISTRCGGINPPNVLGLFRTNDPPVEAATIYVRCLSNRPFLARGY